MRLGPISLCSTSLTIVKLNPCAIFLGNICAAKGDCQGLVELQKAAIEVRDDLIGVLQERIRGPV